MEVSGCKTDSVLLKVTQARDDLLLMKQPWHKCSDRWVERWRGSVRKKTSLGAVRVRESERE